jgi:hypothetical protein
VLLQPKSSADFDFGAQQAVQFLVPPVVTRVAGADFQESIRTGLSADGEALVEVTATDEPGTGVIEIEAVATDPATATEAASDAADALRDDPVSDLIEVTVLNAPTVAESISASRRAVILLGSLVLGLIAAVFVAVAAHLLRPRTSSGRQISERFGLQVIGEIPYRRGISHPSNVPTNGTGPHAIDDAFQKLAVNIEILTKPNATIALTSWGQGEGKTMVAARLAWAIASLGHELVAVDCDLRKPALHIGLGVDPAGGIAEIAGGSDPVGLRQQTVLDNFTVISAGEPPRGAGNPLRLITEALPRLTRAFNDRIVLIDTPPVRRRDQHHHDRRRLCAADGRRPPDPTAGDARRDPRSGDAAREHPWGGAQPDPPGEARQARRLLRSHP